MLSSSLVTGLLADASSGDKKNEANSDIENKILKLLTFMSGKSDWIHSNKSSPPLFRLRGERDDIIYIYDTFSLTTNVASAAKVSKDTKKTKKETFQFEGYTFKRGVASKTKKGKKNKEDILPAMEICYPNNLQKLHDTLAALCQNKKTPDMKTNEGKSDTDNKFKDINLLISWHAIDNDKKRYFTQLALCSADILEEAENSHCLKFDLGNMHKDMEIYLPSRLVIDAINKEKPKIIKSGPKGKKTLVNIDHPNICSYRISTNQFFEAMTRRLDDVIAPLQNYFTPMDWQLENAIATKHLTEPKHHSEIVALLKENGILMQPTYIKVSSENGTLASVYDATGTLEKPLISVSLDQVYASQFSSPVKDAKHSNQMTANYDPRLEALFEATIARLQDEKDNEANTLTPTKRS